MTDKAITLTLEFIVPTALAIVLAISLSICAVYLTDCYLGPIEQAEAYYSAPASHWLLKKLSLLRGITVLCFRSPAGGGSRELLQAYVDQVMALARDGAKWDAIVSGCCGSFTPRPAILR
jgi:hypothetical protein